MKKLLINFCVMATILASTVSVFANTYSTVSDSFYFRKGELDNADAILRGKQDNTTDKLSNVTREYKKYGKATIKVGDIKRPSQYTANMYVECWFNAQKGTKTLKI